MIIVEHEFPIFQWGTSFAPNADFLLERKDDCLQIAGFDPFLALEQRPELRSWDLLDKYRKAPKDWGATKRTGKKSPHMQFANADTDAKLIAFVGKFGPVVARSVREKPEAPGTDQLEPVPPPIRTAEQDMNELRSECALYRSTLELFSEVVRENRADIAVVRHCIADIADRVADWPRQWQRERQLRDRESRSPISWEFNEEAVRGIWGQKANAESVRPSFGERIAGDVTVSPSSQLRRALTAAHSVICELVNAFKPWIYRWGHRTIQGPHWDLYYGIRPLLYHILRQEYVERAGVALCANTQCRDLFLIERAGQHFCGEECSQRQRQRAYWAKRGKNLREKRLKPKNAAKHAPRKGR